jgi:hypothetical protein
VTAYSGHAIAQAVSRRLPTAAARDRSQVTSCGICGGQSGTGAGFLRVFGYPSQFSFHRLLYTHRHLSSGADADQIAADVPHPTPGNYIKLINDCLLSIFPVPGYCLLCSQSEDATCRTDITTSDKHNTQFQLAHFWYTVCYMISLGLCSQPFVNCIYGVHVSARTRDKVTCYEGLMKENVIMHYSAKFISLIFPRGSRA